MKPSPRARVIGAGVTGLSSALRLLDAGYDVEIWTRDLPQHTTSSVAAAIWYAYKCGPADKVERWARESYAEFAELASVPESGVLMRSGLELLPNADAQPAWRSALEEFRIARADELVGDARSGFVFTVPVVEMPVYLAHLLQRFLARGGRLRARAVAAIDDALDGVALLVNCTGLGARELAGDRELYPIRGELVRVERGDVTRFVLDDYSTRGITYVVPRAQDCVLGGTSIEGSDDLTPDERELRGIRERCTALVPELAGARVLSTAIGLRPGRASVRLEAEIRRPGTLLVHNYGHGGAGVTLSWGCANEVVALATASGVR